MISDSAQAIIDRRTAHAHARDEESFIKARDIARQKFGIDWVEHGFVVVSARDMVLEVREKGERIAD
ncbi:MAG: hypothetical protein AAB864_01635 [Patescibacteria group bacterium]